MKLEPKASMESVEKLAGILKIASIDIECITCKEVYPDFLTKLIFRVTQSVKNQNALRPQKHFRTPWAEVHQRDMTSTIKSKPQISNQKAAQISPEGVFPSDLKTPQTKRYHYSIAKTNEVGFSGRLDRANGPKELTVGKNVRINEIKEGKRYVFGRSGCKWGNGEQFHDVLMKDFYEGAEGNITRLGNRQSRSKSTAPKSTRDSSNAFKSAG